MDLLSQKICDELPRGTVFGVSQREKIHRFAQLAIYCCMPCWAPRRNAASPPFNDLELLQFMYKLYKYKAVEKCVANSAMKAITKYLWYLTEEMIPLSCFSPHASVVEKEKMVETLLEKEARSSDLAVGLANHGFQN